MDGSFFDDFGKNSLGRHDALAHFLLNGTSLVAFLADLGDFLNGFTNLKTSAHRQFIETDALCCQILCKLPRGEILVKGRKNRKRTAAAERTNGNRAADGINRAGR